MLYYNFNVLTMNYGARSDPDTVTGLTPREINLVQTIWSGLLQKAGETGVAIFNILFEHNPEYRQLFPFKDVPDEDWLENETFLNHVNTSFKGFTPLIDTIDDPDILKLHLFKIMKSHEKRNLTEQHFIDLKEAMTGASFIFYNEKEERESWRKAMNIIFDLIVQKFGEKDDE